MTQHGHVSKVTKVTVVGDKSYVASGSKDMELIHVDRQYYHIYINLSRRSLTTICKAAGLINNDVVNNIIRVHDTRL
jgi:hypothetical protein